MTTSETDRPTITDADRELVLTAPAPNMMLAHRAIIQALVDHKIEVYDGMALLGHVLGHLFAQQFEHSENDFKIEDMTALVDTNIERGMAEAAIEPASSVAQP